MRPTNTKTQSPLVNLFEAGFAGVEYQEARGQREVVNSMSLPTECYGKAALEAAGVKFGQPYENDPLFCDAVLPQGWSKRATDHAMYSDLVDDKGRVRASIFYKAACYDRRADMRVVRRYNTTAYESGSTEGNCRCVVRDGKTIIHDLGEYKRGYEAAQKMEQKAVAWLAEKFPDWESAAAYWD
jgi:hypothetical protein